MRSYLCSNTVVIISASGDVILECAKKVIFLRDCTIDMEKSRGMEIEKGIVNE
jgi:hypothetical protein